MAKDAAQKRGSVAFLFFEQRTQRQARLSQAAWQQAQLASSTGRQAAQKQIKTPRQVDSYHSSIATTGHDFEHCGIPRRQRHAVE